MNNMGIYIYITLEATIMLFTSVLAVNAIIGDNVVFKLLEDKPIRTLVGKLNHTKRTSDLQFIQHGVFREFLIDEQSGKIYSRKSFDYEKLSKTQKREGFRFYATLGSIRNISITVKILDINDNFPVFPQSTCHINMEWNAKVGTSEQIINAVDDDEGTNANTTYHIVDGNLFNKFELKTIKTDEEEYLLVRLQSKLNNIIKQVRRFTLNVSACDSHYVQRCSYLAVNISITRTNKVAKFLQQSYTTEVYENVSIGHVIVQVKAINGNPGSSEGIEYSMFDKHRFSVDPRTGKIYVVGKLDAEARASYTLMVIAKYKGRDPAICQVSVTVLDCNDNPPNVSVKYLNTNAYSVIEGAAIGSKVLILSAYDIDKDARNNQVSLRLLNTEYFRLRREEGSTYSVCVRKTIDREVTPRFVIRIYASDNGVPRLHKTVKIPVLVGDVNDNVPKFAKQYQSILLNESVTIGSKVLTVRATDLDIGNNGVISYHIVYQSVGHWFTISERTGAITVIKALDRELAPTVIIKVSATDHGSSPLSSAMTINITVLDANDNDPYFDPSVIHLNVTENNAVPYSLGLVHAIDRDIVGTSDLRYKLVAPPFSISPNDGELKVMMSLDREVKRRHEFDVLAVDGGGREGSVHVILDVLDVNDNAPVFEKRFYNVSVHENFPVGGVVAYVSATDADDVGRNSQVLYSSNTVQDLFSVDAQSGGIILRRGLVANPEKTSSFMVQVEDSGGLKSAESAKVVLNIVPPCLLPPRFDKMSYNFTVLENNALNTTIGQVIARRPGSESTTFIDYQILRGNNEKMFTIDSFGVIKAVKKIDYEVEKSYRLDMEATDKLNNSLKTDIAVAIKMIDENDNAPTFSVGNPSIAVAEGNPIGYVFYKCVAIDLDSGSNGVVTYRIVNSSGPFDIDSSTGQMFTNGTLDYESVRSYDLYIEAVDGGRPQMKSTIKMSIRIIDVNDNPPLFQNTSYELYVKENVVVGSQITEFVAEDRDSTINGKFFFQLDPSSEDADSFSLNDDGVLSLRRKLDREVKDSYSFKVVVQDKGVPAQKSTARVSVVVEDVNDEDPKFDYASYTFQLREELPAGTVIGAVVIRDRDIGENGKVKCTLRNYNDKFKIITKYTSFYDQSICTISSARIFDREKHKASYNVTIVATDQGEGANTNHMTVKIDITNVHDQPPMFSQNLPYLACVRHGTAKNHLVAKIVARSSDAIPSSYSLNYSLVAMNEREKAALSLFRILKEDKIGAVYTRMKLSNRKFRSVYEVTVCIKEKEFGSHNAMYNYQKLIIFMIARTKKTIFRHHCKQAYVRESQLPYKGIIIREYDVKQSFQLTNIRNYKIQKEKNVDLPFKILKETGLIQLNSHNSLSHRVRPYYQLNVTAEGWRDEKSYKDSIIINIFVVPKNIYPPSYPSNPEDFKIYENVKPSHVFDTLKKANDLDSGMEGQVMYSIAETMPVDAPISISPLSRTIKFTDHVDREKTAQFVVKVRMTDLAHDLSQRLTNTFTVYLSILDINDNPPTFKSRNSSYVYEDDPIGTNVMTIQAEDPDKGETNTNILYEIVSGNEKNVFKLDKHTGHLLTNKTLNIYECQKYQLVLKAYESREDGNIRNITSLASTMVVSVDVIDINNNPPKFTQKTYYASVEENMAVGTTVLQLNATDADLSAHNKEFIFELLDNTELFDIDARTGVLKTKVVLDREQASLHTISIMVKNLAIPLGDDSCVVMVTVQDVNDFPPVFLDGKNIELHIMENRPPATLHKFVVSDLDAGSNADVEYRISSNEDITDITDIFQLDESTGNMFLAKMLDREQRDAYIFSVEAINTSPPKHKAVQHVTVLVDDENDEKPVFSKEKYEVSVSEDQEVNVTIIQVTAIDKDIGTNANIIYTISNDSDDAIHPFGINADTGEIYLVKPLDYEQEQRHVIGVKATGYGFHSYNYTHVVVKVKDVNDNSPIFSKPIYNVSIKKVQTTVPVLRVHARDADENGMQRVQYFFSPHSKKFHIDNKTGSIRIKHRKLTSGQYRLHVKAKDVAYPRQETFAQVLLSIGDANNNVLNFLNSTVVFSMLENPQKDYSLGMVVAKSQGRHPISYSIVETSNPNYAFAINERTGRIYVNNTVEIDYEKHRSFFLGVIAYTKHESKSHTSYLSVLVNLSDVNDNVPKIVPAYGKLSYPETNIKNFPPTYMHLFHVDDADNMDQGKLDIQIISGNDNQVFAIVDWRHLLVVKNVDYEEQQQYNLVVRVTDSATPPHHSDSRILIEVEDRNDNPPVFQHPRSFDVNESTLVGSIIANITATDADVTSTDLIYNIEFPNLVSPIFEIDKYLGKVKLLKHLDYEKQITYVLNVSAFDGIHHTYKLFEVVVLDDNDNDPVFTKRVYDVKVWPEMKKNTNVATVIAKDSDDGDYGHVQYQLDPPKDAFTINQDTGVIFTNKNFKFSPEIYSFKLKVIAFDSYGQAGSRKSTATVNLIIFGKKAAPPRFQQKKYHMSVMEGASVGTTVEQVFAHLPSGLRKELIYNIEGGNHNEAFSIDKNKGLITVNNKIDRETIASYTLELVVHAHGSNESAKCKAFITVQDANDNEPVFENTSYNVFVYENITKGSSLLQMKATDADDPLSDNAVIKYEIHSGQDKYVWLAIDPDTGWVRTRKKLDRETADSIQLTIKASDNRGSGNTALTSLNVTVLDVNDNTPHFSLDISKMHEIEVDENKPVGQIVFKAKATDADEGSNGRVSYRILNGPGRKYFEMKEHETGWVYTSVELNYEDNPVYNLTILAYDHGTPRLDESFEFLINVQDVDEFEPEFKQLSYEFIIFASRQVGQDVGEVRATDADGGPAGLIFYSFTSEWAKFNIHPQTGRITVNDDLRRLTYVSGNLPRLSGNDVLEYSVEVRADNGANSSLYGLVPVVIKVNYSCVECYKDAEYMAEVPDTLTGSTFIVASVAVLVILLVIIALAVYCRRKQTCYHKRKHPPPRFCPSKKGELSPGSSLERELLNSGTSSIDRLPTHFFTEYSSKPATFISSETGFVRESVSGTVRTTSGTDKVSTFSFGIYHEQAIPESELHPFTDNLSDMSLKDLEEDSVFAYPSTKTSKTSKLCVSRSTKESSLYSLTSNPQKGSGNISSSRQKASGASRRDSHESLKDFMEEGGGEAASGMDVGNLLYAKLAEVDGDEQDVVMDRVQEFNEEGLPSRGGSLSTIIGSDVDIRANFNNHNYIDNWGAHAQFNTVNPAPVCNGGGRHNNEPNKNCKNSAKPKNEKTPPDNSRVSTDNSRRIPKLNTLPHIGSSNKETKQKRTDEMSMGLLNSASSAFITPRTISPNFSSSVMTPLVFRTASTDSLSRTVGGSYQSNVFDMGVLHRNGSVRSVSSQLSRITLSDINVSDEEMEL